MSNPSQDEEAKTWNSLTGITTYSLHSSFAKIHKFKIQIHVKRWQLFWFASSGQRRTKTQLKHLERDIGSVDVLSWPAEIGCLSSRNSTCLKTATCRTDRRVREKANTFHLIWAAKSTLKRGSTLSVLHRNVNSTQGRRQG